MTADEGLRERPNILARRCDHECAVTWRHETHGSEGDVRRCDHGRVWIFRGSEMPYRLDRWDRLYRWAEPIAYHRAVRALAAAARRTTHTEETRDA